MFFNYLPISIRFWIIWGSFVHYFSNTMHEWSINNITMTCYPSNISSTKVDVIFPKIKDPFSCCIKICKIATCTVQLHLLVYPLCRKYIEYTEDVLLSTTSGSQYCDAFSIMSCHHTSFDPAS